MIETVVAAVASVVIIVEQTTCWCQPVAVRQAPLLGRWLLPRVRQPLDLACGTLFRSICAIQTSPMDCSDDSWKYTFFGIHEHDALWLLICAALEKHLLTYLLTYLLTVCRNVDDKSTADSGWWRECFCLLCVDKVKSASDSSASTQSKPSKPPAGWYSVILTCCLRTMTSYSAVRRSLKTHFYNLAFLSWFYWLCAALSVNFRINVHYKSIYRVTR